MLSGMFDPEIVIKLERISVLLCLYQEYPLTAVTFAKAPLFSQKTGRNKKSRSTGLVIFYSSDY